MDQNTIISSMEEANLHLFTQPYVAFLDILGFSELVNNNNHDELVKLYKALIELPVKFLSQESATDDIIHEIFDTNEIKLVNISDSIVLWTKNSNEKSLWHLVNAVQLLLQLSMSLGIPLRGSIAKGNITVLENNNAISIVGKGLVSAYQAESKQKWSGCTIDSNIVEYLKSYKKVVEEGTNIIALERLNLIVQTKIPIQNGYKDGYAVNWAKNSNLTENQIIDSFSMYNKRKNETNEIYRKTQCKIKHTIDFFRQFKDL
jgi:hypothetical protein